MVRPDLIFSLNLDQTKLKKKYHSKIVILSTRSKGLFTAYIDSLKPASKYFRIKVLQKYFCTTFVAKYLGNVERDKMF